MQPILLCNYHTGSTETGVQLYKCQSCDENFVEDTVVKPYSYCPHCGNSLKSKPVKDDRQPIVMYVSKHAPSMSFEVLKWDGSDMATLRSFVPKEFRDNTKDTLHIHVIEGRSDKLHTGEYVVKSTLGFKVMDEFDLKEYFQKP